jgi:hypothetical protein
MDLRVSRSSSLAQLILKAWILTCSCALSVLAQQGRQLLQEPAPIAIKDFAGGLRRASYSSWFDGCGEQACGCGIPPGQKILPDKAVISYFNTFQDIDDVGYY